MFINKKVLLRAAAAVLALPALYTGITCAATFARALAQPHLMAGSVRYDFLGFYVLAAANGVVCLLFAAAAVLLAASTFRRKNRRKP